MLVKLPYMVWVKLLNKLLTKLKKKVVNTHLLLSQPLTALNVLVVHSANAVAITKAAKASWMVGRPIEMNAKITAAQT